MNETALKRIGALRPALPVLFLTALALVLRAAWLFHADPVPVADYADYLRLARGLLEKGQFGDPLPSAYRLPAYPCLLALLLALGESARWLGIANVLLATTLVPLAHTIARRLLPGAPGAALCAGALCAVNPTFVFSAPLLASEHLFVPAVLLSLVVLLARARAQPLSPAFLAGAGLALAILTRGEGLFYVPIALGILLATAPRARRLPAALILVTACALPAFLWSARNAAAVGPGSGLSTSGGVNFYYAHNDRRYGWHPLQESELAGLDELPRHRRGLELGLAALRRGGAGKLLRDAAAGTRALLFTGGEHSIFWSTRAAGDYPHGDFPGRAIAGERRLRAVIAPFYVGLLPLALIGLSRLRAMRLPALSALLGLIAMNWLCYAIVFWGMARYRTIAEAAICILAGAGLHRLLASLRRIASARGGAAAARHAGLSR